MPVLCDNDGAFGSPTSDSEKAMIKNSSKNIITIIYIFSEYNCIDTLINKAEKYIKQYVDAKNVETFIVK
jgi:DNA/RNA-binding domain of Phe-tRNA-synthetase-like protein